MMKGFQAKYSDFFTVLFINQMAKKILDSHNIKLNVLDEVEELPEDIGNFISMPHYE